MSTFILHKNEAMREHVEANCIGFIRKLPTTESFAITVERHVAEYTGKQRRSIFGPAYKALMEFAGLQGNEDKIELHRFMCGEFFGWRDTPFGRKPVRTTTKDERGDKKPIGKLEALDFYAFLQRRGAEVGCFVPDPDPFWREKKEAA